MKITELTPPPVSRTFSIEFTEDELRTLGIIFANMTAGDEDSSFKRGSSSITSPSNKPQRITMDMYKMIKDTLNQ